MIQSNPFGYKGHSLTAAALTLLDRRAGRGAIGAEHAAIPHLGLEDGAASLAVIKPLAGVRGMVSISTWPHSGHVIVDFNSILSFEFSIAHTP